MIPAEIAHTIPLLLRKLRKGRRDRHRGPFDHQPPIGGVGPLPGFDRTLASLQRDAGSA